MKKIGTEVIMGGFSGNEKAIKLNKRRLSNALNPIKKKTKTYLSCWSCRARNVKCDLLRPKCQTCIKSNIECEGYEIKLVWEHNYGGGNGTNSEKNGGSRSRNSNRRLIVCDFENVPYMRMKESEVDRLLQDFDNMGPDKIETKHNFKPFGVYIVETGSPVKQESKTSLIKREDEDRLALLIMNKVEQELQTKQYAPLSGIEQAAKIDEMLERYFYEFSRNGTAWTANFKAMKVRFEKLVRIRTELEISNFLNNQLLLRFTQNEVDYDLIGYFLTHLCNIYVAVNSTWNPYQKIVISLLFANIYNNDNIFNQALYHSIVASSAFAIYNTDNDMYYSKLGEYHKKKSLDYIARSFEAIHEDRNDSERINNINLEILIASIFNMVCCEVVRGDKDWILHLKGFLKLIHLLKFSICYNDHKISEELNFMLQMFKCFIGINFSNELIDISEEDVSQLVIIDELTGQDYLLDHFYGITNDELNLFIRLASIKRTLDVQEVEIRSSNKDLTDADMMTFRKQFIENSNIYEEMEEKGMIFEINEKNLLIPDINQAILFYQSKAFYIACRIYFMREVLKCNLVEVQSIVEEGIILMEEIERLSYYNDFKFGSVGIIYPNVIICCECTDPELRLRIGKWYNDAMKYNFAVIAKARLIVEAVWKRRARVGDEQVSFNDIIKEKGVHFILS